MRMRKLLPVLLILLTTTLISAQSAQVTTPAQVRGRVMDSSGSVMPGVTVKVYQGEKVLREVVSSGTGDFQVPVAPGEYRLEVTAPDFDTYTEVVNVTPELGPLSITMQLAQIAQNVEVTSTRNEINIDSDSSLNTTVLGRDFIETLPEDEDELAAYLQQIAGSRGGGGGGNFVIDGFGGGRLPPKDQIQEIRINNNPFSSEFSGIGYGRVEIVTRPGTGDYRGNLNFQFRDESLNARNPFDPAKPAAQSRNFNTNFSGPIIRNKLTLSMNARHGDSENSETINAILPAGLYSAPVVRPNENRRLETRSQLAVTPNNSVYFNFNYNKNDNRNQGVGDFSLEERAFDRSQRNMSVQIRETAILNKAMVHEARFEFRRDRSLTAPRTTGRAINVLDSFQTGASQNRGSNRDREVEFGNLLMYSGSKWTIKTGVQGEYFMNRSLSENNFAGTYTFSSLADFIAGRPLTYRQNQGDPRLDVNQFQFASFIQSDWKATQKFNLSFGVRHEIQTNIGDRNNFDPRFGFAYQLGKTTALRGGVGMFHQRMGLNTVQELLRMDGTRQLEIVIPNPLFPDPFLDMNGTVGARPPASLRTRAEELAAPYNMNSSISVEQSLPIGLGLTFSWDSIRGIHLYRSRNINAPLPGLLVRPDPAKGNLNQVESTGLSRSNNFTIGFRQSLRNRLNLNLFGNYTLGSNKSDTDGFTSLPANNYDLAAEWGRSNQDTRHRIFTGSSFRIPWNVNMNLNLNWSSSRPYNITTGRDNNLDTVINDRPDGGARNSGKGPGNFSLNTNFQKTVSLRKAETSGPAGNNGGANPFANSFAGQRGGGNFPGGGVQGGNFPGGGQRGGGNPGGNRGPDGRGQDGRGPGGNFGQPGGPTMTFQINVQNVLNNQQLNGYSGVMTSSYFGRANSARNPRQIEAGLRFNF